MNEETRPALLVLAASLYQLPFIRRARARGCRVITLDNVPANPGHALADVAYPISTTEAEAVLQVARREQIQAVVAPCTDVAVPTAARVAEALGLPGVPPRAADVVCRKSAFRAFQKEQGFPHPRWGVWDGNAESPAWSRFPAVVKPDMASGAKGVRQVTSPADLVPAWEQARQHSLTGRALVEEFLPGRQMTCEGFWDGTRIAASWLTDRLTAELPYTTTLGHDYPSGLPPAEAEKVRQDLDRLLGALAVGPTVFDADLVVEDGKLVILELALRVGGNSIVSLVEAASGVNLVEVVLDVALGREPSLASSHEQAVALRILASPVGGTLRYRESQRQPLPPGIVSLTLDVPDGSRVQPATDSRYRFGEVIAVGSTLEQARERLDEAVAILELRVER